MGRLAIATGASDPPIAGSPAVDIFQAVRRLGELGDTAAVLTEVGSGRVGPEGETQLGVLELPADLDEITLVWLICGYRVGRC